MAEVAVTQAGPRSAGGFTVDLPVYAGPFDVLLTMIANRRLELNELALSTVTAEFLQYTRGLDLTQDIGEVSAFVDVASMLLEAKSLSLLPHEQQEQLDERSLEVLRERDLLFARLVQYRAFKRAAQDFSVRLAEHAGRFPHRADLLSAAPALPVAFEWSCDAARLAQIAAEVFRAAPAQDVAVAQLHVPKVDLRAQAALVEERLRSLASDGSMTFSQLVSDAVGRLEVVARFLAVLTLFKRGRLQFRQPGPFERLDLRWVADDSASAPGNDGIAGSARGLEVHRHG